MNTLFTSTVSRSLAFIVAAIALVACGGGSNGDNSNPVVTSPPPTFSVTGTVTGLAGAGLTLANGASSIAVGANGTVSIAGALANSASYSVTVGTQPSNPNQVCTVNNASGAIAGANVTNVAVNCVTTPPIAATLTIAFGLKQLKFSWNAVSGANFYRLLQNPDSVSGFTQIGGDLTTLSTTIDIAVHRHDFPNARYLLEACNSGGCTSSNQVNTIGAALQTIGYFKASKHTNNDGDELGYSVALSADGNTLAVGAPLESNNAIGVNGDQNSSIALYSGAVYVFAKSAGTWTQQAYIKASNTDGDDQFGFAISLSADGNTLAVGARNEASNATGIDGDQSNNSARIAGAVYVYTRTGIVWTQQAYVKSSNASSIDYFGIGVALSGDGNTLAVGAIGEDSNSRIINGDETNNLASSSGAAYVFVRNAGVWKEQAYIKASNADADDWFGHSVSLSYDGNTLAVGAIGESSIAVGINGDQSDNSASYAGAVYVFTRDASITRNAGTWTQQAYVKAFNTAASNEFGASITLSGDGNTLAVGALGESSNSNGINGLAPGSGAAYVFARSAGVWKQQAFVKTSNAEALDYFGCSVAISMDGNTLAVGAFREASNAMGIDGDQANNLSSYAGAAYVFARSAGAWKQQTYVKASNTEALDQFGSVVALSGDGNTLAVGAFAEDSNAIGVNGDQNSNSAGNSGAVYLY